MTVSVRSYLSPPFLLAFDWPDAASRSDFLGFAIRRTPGSGRPTARRARRTAGCRTA